MGEHAEFQNYSRFAKILATELNALKLVAATVNDIPRLVEFINDYFRDLPLMVLDGNAISDIYFMIFEKINQWYGLKFSSANDGILVTIILSRPIRMDDPDLIAAITNSLITNTITIFDPEEYLNKYTASILMMLAMTRKDKNPSPFKVTVRRLLTSIIESLKDTYEEFKREATFRAHISGRKSNPKDHNDEGLLLEKIVRYWLQLKLAAAAAATITKEVDGITLLQLLSFNDQFIIPEEYQELFLTPLFFHKYIPAVQLRYNSQDANALFLGEL